MEPKNDTGGLGPSQHSRSFLHLLIDRYFDLIRPSSHATVRAMSPQQPCTTLDSYLSMGYSEKGGNGEEEEEEVVVGWELMEECWSEAEGEVFEGGCAVRFMEDPYSSLLVVQSSSSYVTINGNEESCGSSFSDCGTSLMATLHYSATPTHHHPFLPINAAHDNHDDDDDDDDDAVLPTFLGLRDRDHDHQDLLPPNSQL